MPKIALAAVLVFACAVAGVARPAPTSFTGAQAAAGAKLFAAKCSMCHGARLEGITAPRLRGGTVLAMKTGAEVFEFMSQQMPLTAPGSLKPAQYLALMAFLLKVNGHHAGKTPLTAASAKTIATPI